MSLQPEAGEREAASSSSPCVSSCLPIRGHGFVLDKYTCLCRKGFYHPNRVALNGFTSQRETKPRRRTGEGGPEAGAPASSSSSACRPCADGCAMVLLYHCRRNKGIRASGLILLETILCGALLLYFPRTSTLPSTPPPPPCCSSSGPRGLGWGLACEAAGETSARPRGLITERCGQVLILYFQPSVFRCILLRWVRLLGFATVYGTLTLKLYR
ncbi:hypothetical protein NHX12_021586, partial [Muraenolepis orangiensis]